MTLLHVHKNRIISIDGLNNSISETDGWMRKKDFYFRCTCKSYLSL